MTDPAPLPRSAIPGIAWPSAMQGVGASLMAQQWQYEQSERWPAERLAAQQFRQIAELVAQCRAHVPFWRDRLAAAGLATDAALTQAAFRRLPVLTRRDIQEGGAALHANPPPAGHGAIARLQTSGSTGAPVTCLSTEMARFFGFGAHLRELLWHGWDPTSRLAAILDHHDPATAAPDGKTLANWGPPYAQVFETGPAFKLDMQAPIAAQADWLSRNRADILVTWSANLEMLARHCLDTGLTLPNLRVVRTLAEPVTPALRALCRLAWNIEPVDAYSAEEVGVIALQCEKGGLHVQSENVLLELLDEQGAPCPPGQPGRVVATSLHNFAMPLLRYELGDWAEFGPPCRCGRHLPTLSRIWGREQDRLLMADGQRRFANIPDAPFAALPDVLRHQVAQVAPDTLEIRLLARRHLTAAEQDALAVALTDSLGQLFQVRFVYPDSFASGPRTKFRPIVCELSAP